MGSAIGVASTIILLLPGFMLLLVRQSTGEYERLSNFESTIVSVGYSVVVFSLFVCFGLLLQWTSMGRYGFVGAAKEVVLTRSLPQLKNHLLITSLLVYLNAFAVSSLWVYNSHWIGFWKKIRKWLGLHRFTDHLTPWEDFLTLNKFNWLAVELKDGRTLVGKIGAYSHLPFQRQLLLKGVDAPIVVYDKEHRKVGFGPPIYQSYIPMEEIRTIHSVRDDKIKVFLPKYTTCFLSLICSSAYLTLFTVLLGLNLTGAYLHSPMFDILTFLFALLSISLNLSFLSRFS